MFVKVIQSCIRKVKQMFCVCKDGQERCVCTDSQRCIYGGCQICCAYDGSEKNCTCEDVQKRSCVQLTLSHACMCVCVGLGERGTCTNLFCSKEPANGSGIGYSSARHCVNSCRVFSTGAMETEQIVGRELPQNPRSLYGRSVAHLNTQQATEVYQLLSEFSDTFSEGAHDLGRTDLVKHQINTGGAAPIRQPPRRLPFAKRDEANKAVGEMHKQGIIEPSKSPWSSPVVLVKKKNGGLRFCMDYRKLNDVTRKDSYPLPCIDESIEALSGAKWFSTLDLKSGYWQVELDPQDKEKTAFSLGNGLWQFTVMPFGLANAPATFERLMEQVLTGLPLNTALIYLDDVLVAGRSFSDQLMHLHSVLQRLRNAGLKLAPEKCFLFQKEVKYLGHVVSEEGITTDPEKIEAVKLWPRPTNAKELHSFIGFQCLSGLWKRTMHFRS